MKIIHNLVDEKILDEKCVFTFGTFDGVHLGHQFLFHYVQKLKNEKNRKSVILTFSNHPAEILCPENKIVLLTTREEKLKLIERFGFDLYIEIPFDEKLKNLSADNFFEMLVQNLAISEWVTGADVTFGSDRKGDRAFVVKHAPKYGIECHFLERFTVESVPVSSSLIRRCLKERNFPLCEKYLGRNYLDKAF